MSAPIPAPLPDAPAEPPSGAQGPVERPPFGQRARSALRALVRDPNPILLKELRANLRTPLFVRFLTVAVALVATVVLAGSAAFSEGHAAPAEVGRGAYHTFFTVVWLVLVFASPGQAASAFTLEKETKTWESLLLSGMSPERIVVGKFLALFGSAVLVLAAVAPVIGVSFLFGGVSPLATLLAFAWLLGALAVAVSFGIAVSARVESTRVAVLLTTVVFLPLALQWVGLVVAFGEPAQRGWGTPFDGPFWFGPAFADRAGSLDAWLLLVALPAFFFGMLVWLNLAGAIAGVKAPGLDRSSGLKLWSLVAGFGTVVAVVGGTLLASDAGTAGQFGILFSGFAIVVLFVLVSLLFANEPPLPPRLGAPTAGLPRWLWSAFGPGAAPTLRFTFLVLAVGIAACCLGPALPRHLRFPGARENEAADVAALVLATGAGSVLAALAALAAWLRGVLRSGAAARVLAVVAFAALAFGAMLMLALVDPTALGRFDHEVNPILGLSPIGPFLAAIRCVDDPRSFSVGALDDVEWLTLGLAPCVYGLVALGLWLLVEARSREVARLVEDHRARLLAKLGPPPAAAPGPDVPAATP